METATGVMPIFFTVSSAARSTSVAGAFVHPGGKVANAQALNIRAGIEASLLGTLAKSPGSGPVMACSTSIVSSTLRAIGPSLSSDQQSVMAPVRGTRPIGGAQAGDAAAHGRTDDAAFGFTADSEAHKPCSGGRARAGARTGRAFFQQPRIHGLAAKPDVVERQRAQAQLGHQHGAGVDSDALYTAASSVGTRLR